MILESADYVQKREKRKNINKDIPEDIAGHRKQMIVKIFNRIIRKKVALIARS